MESYSFRWWQILGMGLLYLVFVVGSCFAGFLHPVCWAFFSVLAGLLASGPYFWLSARWHHFGVGTFCAMMVCLFCLATGEAGGVLSKSVILGGGVVSDVIRVLNVPSSKKSIYAAYPFLAIGNIGWIIRLWSDKQWYFEGAVREMGEDYARGIAPLQTTGILISVIVVTAVMAVIAVWLCGKVDKKSANLLK